MGRFIGVDLHRNCFTVCLLAENDREYISEYRLEDVDRFLRKLRATDQVAVEGDEIFRASPAPSNGQIFFRSDRALYCVGKRSAK